jgi:hypothetical protein
MSYARAAGDPVRQDARAAGDPARQDARAAGDPARQDARAAGDPARHNLDYHGDAEPGAAGLDLAVNGRLPRPPAWLLARMQNAMTGLASYPRQDAVIGCIERAATARQRVTRCTLGDLATPGRAPAIGNPAVIVIGPTVSSLQHAEPAALSRTSASPLTT